MGAGTERRTKMLEILSRYWWAFVVRGIFAILFGILAYAWPGITLATLIIFFGAYVLIDGILLVIKTIGKWGERDDRWLLLLEGLLGIGIGVITFVAPGITAVALIFFIAAWSLATGVLSGIASIVFAVLVMFFPGAGALGLLWLIAAYAIIFGVMLVILGIKLRGHRSRSKVATVTS
jgi:uncharacterized membrane protein HdeD (DUF308 family)